MVTSLSVCSTKQLIDNRDLANAVKRYGSAVSQPKSCEITVMFGYDAVGRPVLESEAAPLGLCAPVEQASGPARRHTTQGQCVMHGGAPEGVSQRFARVVAVSPGVDEDGLAANRQPHGKRVGVAVGCNGEIANRSVVKGENGRCLALAPDHRVAARRE